jgi:hypothetical protein
MVFILDRELTDRGAQAADGEESKPAGTGADPILVIGSDDDEPIVAAAGELANTGAKGRAPISAPDAIRLLLGAAFIDPFIPAIDQRYGPVRPDRPEERAMRHLFDPGVDRRGSVGRRRPRQTSQTYRRLEQTVEVVAPACLIGNPVLTSS